MEPSNDEIREIWNDIAPFWDEYMGEEGNLFHRTLVAPAAEWLLGIEAGERVLEVACGAGLFARRLRELGADVVATDFSEAFLERARRRLEGVEVRRLDGSDEAAIAALGADRFDAAVANMALMDMRDIVPLFRGLARVVRPGGRFVLTVLHPCFYNDSTVRFQEQQDVGGDLRTTVGVKVSRYRTLEPTLGLGIVGQPRPHWYFHRTLTDLLTPAFAAGWVLDNLTEATLSPEAAAQGTLSPAPYAEIPPILGARLRRLRS